MTDQLGLEEHLVSIAKTEIAKHGFFIASNCEGNLRNLMKRAISNMYLDNRANDPLHIALAEAILSQVAVRMMIEARNEKSNTCHEGNLGSVEGEFLSHWPWTNRY
jgi:hypothetical protein